MRFCPGDTPAFYPPLSAFEMGVGPTRQKLLIIAYVAADT
jgi:hypothetical protein